MDNMSILLYRLLNDPSKMGYTSYLAQLPPNVLCEFYNPSHSYSTFVGYPSTLSPEMDASNLYWRLTGIGKEEVNGRTGR